MKRLGPLFAIAIVAVVGQPAIAAYELWTFQFAPNGSLPYRMFGDVRNTRADVAGNFALRLDWIGLTGQLVELDDRLENIHDEIFTESGPVLQPTDFEWDNLQILHSSGAKRFNEGPFTFQNGMWKVTGDGQGNGVPYTIMFDWNQASFSLEVPIIDAPVQVLNAPATFSSARIAGDFDGNLVVDATDYVLWRKFDGGTTGYDFWRGNFGYEFNDSAFNLDVTVPEPATMLNLVAAALLVAVSCRVRGRQLS
jgi:hypothetical protein